MHPTKVLRKCIYYYSICLQKKIISPFLDADCISVYTQTGFQSHFCIVLIMVPFKRTKIWFLALFLCFKMAHYSKSLEPKWKEHQYQNHWFDFTEMWAAFSEPDIDSVPQRTPTRGNFFKTVNENCLCLNSVEIWLKLV